MADVEEDERPGEDGPPEVVFSGNVTLPAPNWKLSQLETSSGWAGPIHWKDGSGD